MAAEQLGIVYATYAAYEQGRGCALEGALRRLMDLMPPPADRS